ncbi:MAG: Ig-like domain-containing protein, partial [Oscillospiraceae bacterium]|nr:Ig-like domain-containing protein [Oscillospiraceae bacterium]
MEKHKIDIHKIISTITAIIIAAGAVVGALYIINPDIFKSKNICNDCEKRPCECATFISITPPTAIIRNNGVAKTNQGLNLPPTVTIITSEGEVQASVTWDLNSFIYNPSITTAQGFIAKGIITLPED